MAMIAEASPALPEALNDRAQDNWELLLAIADAAGGPWPQKAREAALALSGTKDEPASLGEELLRDIWDIFAEKTVDRIAGADLVIALVAKEERPWGDANRGKPITQAWLARRFAQFRVRSKNIRDGSRIVKGYEREMFQDAFSRYIPPFKPLRRYKALKTMGYARRDPPPPMSLSRWNRWVILGGAAARPPIRPLTRQT